MLKNNNFILNKIILPMREQNIEVSDVIMPLLFELSQENENNNGSPIFDEEIEHALKGYSNDFFEKIINIPLKVPNTYKYSPESVLITATAVIFTQMLSEIEQVREARKVVDNIFNIDKNKNKNIDSFLNSICDLISRPLEEDLKKEKIKESSEDNMEIDAVLNVLKELF